MLVGRDASGSLHQYGLTYRDTSIMLDDALLTLNHSVLGDRSVAHLVADPVAVREMIQLILGGGEGASYSKGAPIFPVRGTGG